MSSGGPRPPVKDMNISDKAKLKNQLKNLNKFNIN